MVFIHIRTQEHKHTSGETLSALGSNLAIKANEGRRRNTESEEMIL